MEVLPLMTESGCARGMGRGSGIGEEFGHEPDDVISPGTYDEKHIARIGHLHDCIAYGPGILDLRTAPTNGSASTTWSNPPR